MFILVKKLTLIFNYVDALEIKIFINIKKSSLFNKRIFFIGSQIVEDL